MQTLSRASYPLAYHASAGKSPSVIFCGGFHSNMNGTKALALEDYCQRIGQAYIRFDYFAHGASTGDFAEGSVTQWLADVLAVIDELAHDEVVLVGSSMGGWLALLAALRRPKQVLGLLLLACAADMTKYYPERLAERPKEYDKQGREFYRMPNEYDDQDPYHIYSALLNDGAQYCLLDQPIALSIPVHLMHGKNDDVVPWQRSAAVMQQLESTEVVLHLLKHGDHRLSEPSDLDLMTSIVHSLAAE